jgi:hypothetical protein
MGRVFAQREGTSSQVWRLMRLMLVVMAVYIETTTFLRFIARSEPPGHQELSRISLQSRVTLFSPKKLSGLVASAPSTAMPRLRGTPRRGASWYAAKSRRKRKEAFEKAMVIAARRRRSRGKAIIEEAPPDERQENLPEYTWFSVPGHWNSRLNVGADSTTGTAEGQGHADSEAPYMPCYVEEEAPPEHNQPDPATQSSPPHADYLSLLFEVRHLLTDQVFRIERLEQRIDLFFAAHSRATPKKQCPTCARVYVFPARWRHTEAADALLGSAVT